MKKYTHILFDLDHTLWDFEKNSEETLYTLFDEFALGEHEKFDCDSFYREYKFVNAHLWSLYGKGKITQEELRHQRFQQTLLTLGLQQHQIPAGLPDAYTALCPTKTAVFPYTHEVLAYLQPNYGLHIITNGFKEVQHVKMSSSQLHAYFGEVVTSECCGYKKPDKRIFEHALARINVQPEECLMVGDNLECDIEGARAAGIDQVFFNPERVQHQASPTYEIGCLSELKHLL